LFGCETWFRLREQHRLIKSVPEWDVEEDIWALTSRQQYKAAKAVTIVSKMGGTCSMSGDVYIR
jgi:hypothetical protein